MSNNVNQNNQALYALSRLSKKFDGASDEMNDLMKRQASGENIDPGAFSQLLNSRLVMQDAMKAQFQLYEKPLKTVMTESK